MTVDTAQSRGRRATSIAVGAANCVVVGVLVLINPGLGLFALAGVAVGWLVTQARHRRRRRIAIATARKACWRPPGTKLGPMGETDAFTERAALLALLDERPSLPGEHRRASWSDIALEVSVRGSASSLWDETHALTLDGMADPDGVLDSARHRLQAWADADFDVLTVLDADYPLALRGIHEMPPILFAKGILRSDDVGVSIVGSRGASPKGRSMAANIATGLFEPGLSVISGLADGIDTAAHQATLEAGGRPVGVIGPGINRGYPSAPRSPC